ncbi:uncharacterized protein DS421_18g617670 [Arachis hypogaea]|nr:uncharacterized protein DS421_18g617670 [Arachis hypogaea]
MVNLVQFLCSRFKLASGTCGLKLLSIWVWCSLRGCLCIGLEFGLLGALLVTRLTLGLFD